MKPNVVVAVITAFLAIGAGVAIAGLPSTTPGADVRVLEVPTISTDPIATIPSVTVQPLATSPASTDSASTTTAAPSSDGTTAATTTTTTTTITTTPLEDITITTQPPPNATTTLPDPADDLRARGSLDVGVANGSGVGGIAGDTAASLIDLGYTTADAVNSMDTNEWTLVYYEPALQLEAARLADDLGWDPIAIAPMSDMPDLDTAATYELVAFIGLSSAPPAGP